VGDPCAERGERRCDRAGWGHRARDRRGS
jgi:hypothetical protein